MKKYIYLIFITILFIGTACDKEFLEPVNHNGLLASTLYTDSVKLKMATFGVYKYLQSTGDFSAKGLYGYDMWVFGDVTADLVDARNFAEGHDPVAIQRGLQTPSNSTLNRLWQRNYVIVRRANDVIVNAPKVPNLPENLRDKYLGELRFLRALAYFNLIRIYGGRPHVASENVWGIPMMTEAVESLNQTFEKPRGTVDEAYNVIIEDLKFAGEKLPKNWDSNNVGRATKGAAYGLLSKVYMTMAGTSGNTDAWTNAEKYAKMVMELGIYNLWKKPGVLNNAYANLFRIEAENGSESLFEIQAQSKDYGFGESYNNILAPDGLLAQNNKGWVYPTQELVDMYEEGDIRKQASIFQKGDAFIPDKTTEPIKNYTYDPSKGRASLTGYHVKKYISGKAFEDKWETGPANVRVLRFAEILLIMAEAANELGRPLDAIGFVDQVRERAGLSGLPTDLSQNELRQAIWKERGLELFMEGDRWFDLKRTDRILERLKTINAILPKSLTDASKSEEVFLANFNTNKHYIMPIPQGEVDITNEMVKQAPEY